MRTSIFKLLFALLLAAACVPASTTVESAAAGGPAEDPCPRLGCGLNGTWLGLDVPVRILDATGAPNPDHISIESFRDRLDRPLATGVIDDELFGRRPTGEAVRGADLTGAVLTLRRAEPGKPVQRYFLTIASIQRTPFWTECAPGAPCEDYNTVPLYYVTFQREGDAVKQSVCKPLDDDPDHPFSDHVVIFRGDYYNDDGYAITVDKTSKVFNLACAGTAIAKLHMLRHTAAASRGGLGQEDARYTTIAQRQTLLRMLTADYCGVGHPFTEDGVPLRYRFLQTWQVIEPPFVASPSSPIDALWGPYGAGCIATPRLAAFGLQPELLSRIAAVCPALHPLRTLYGQLRTCPSPSTAGWTDATLATIPHGYAISATP